MTDTMTLEKSDIPARMVNTMHEHDGLAPVDIDRFWHEQEISRADPFGNHIPQVPLGMLMSTECVFDELGLKEDWYRLAHDPEWAHELYRAYNDKAETIVGRRLLRDTPPDPAKQYPQVKGLHDLFEAENVWYNESYWLQQSADNEEELKALLDRVEERLAGNLKGFLLPDNWDQEKERLQALGVQPPLYRSQRGPVTFATSVYGTENLIFLINDNETLARRFSDIILRAMLARGRIIDEEAGYTPETAPRGFGFADDNCYLMTPDMYELFGYPILKGVFEYYAPDKGDKRFQHSDSAMNHILPLLGRLDLTGTNFGPTVTVAEIRHHLPRAVIFGELAPFTLSRNDEEGIVSEFLRDFAQTRDERGLLFTTAGSINNGSRLTAMRLLMATIQEYGRYDR